MTPEMEPAVTHCANCHSPMPPELRFCRNCGFRLGEGAAEYTETVRFQNVPPGNLPGNSSAPFNPYGGAAGAMATYPPGRLNKRKRRLSGMTWIFLGLLIFFVAAAGFTAIFKSTRPGGIEINVPQRPPRSYVGVGSFDTTEGGVTFDNVEPPGSPADLAALVGGDIITTFDGHAVKTDDEMMELLGDTPIGKTVDVVYIRDGETKTTKLTTISKAEFDHLQEAYASRPQGRAQFGYEDGEAERVPIAGTNLYGVRLGEILPNRPADIAGIKEGDVVIEFDKIPIRTTDEFLSRVRRADPYSTVKIVVMRGAERLEIPVKMGKQT